MSDTEIPTVDAPQTQYLITYLSGAVVVDVHEMIDRVEADDPTFQAVHLLTPGGGTTPVDVNDVWGGTQFEIIGGDLEVVLESIRYTALDRGEFVEHEVHDDIEVFEPAA